MPPQYNFIDPLVDAKLERLNIVPSALCTDEEYLRRVYLDVIGTLPTPDEVRSFLADGRADRRQQVVDRCCGGPNTPNTGPCDGPICSALIAARSA